MHITHICPRFKEVHGGGEPVLLNLFQNLCDMEHKTKVITYNYPDSMRGLLDNRVELVELPKLFNRKFNNVLISGFYDLFCTIFFTFYIKDTDIVCFHTENVIPALFFYKLLCVVKKPSIYFCFQPPRFAYDTAEETAKSGGTFGNLVPLLKFFYRPFDRTAVRMADKIATFSNGYKKWIETIYDVQNVSVLPPGVVKPENIGELPEDIQKKISLPDNKTIIFVGKLVAWKNVDRLINVTLLVKKKIPNIRLLVVGDGPCMKILTEQANTLGLQENVIFCGYVSAENVFSYCAKSDLLVLLEKNASFGLALIEANSTGLPVIAFEGGGPSDIINNRKNGFLLPVEIADEQISDLITHYLADPNLSHKMKNHAKSMSKQYTWRRFAEMFVDLAHKLIH